MKKKQPWLQTMAAIALAASAVLPGMPVSAEEPKSTKTEQLIVDKTAQQ